MISTSFLIFDWSTPPYLFSYYLTSLLVSYKLRSETWLSKKTELRVSEIVLARNISIEWRLDNFL